MKNVLAIGIVAMSLSLGGCYRATIDTGEMPTAKTVDVPWAHGWVFGLVPPKTVDTKEACTNGVAKVETQLSFVNQLVSFFTLSIYTPMAIKVTCAE